MEKGQIVKHLNKVKEERDHQSGTVLNLKEAIDKLNEQIRNYDR